MTKNIKIISLKNQNNNTILIFFFFLRFLIKNNFIINPTPFINENLTSIIILDVEVDLLKLY